MMNNLYAYEGIVSTAAAIANGGAAPVFAEDEQQQVVNFVSEASRSWYRALKPPYRLAIIGLGDVGRTLAVGLKLLAPAVLSEIGIYDLDTSRVAALEMELNQIYDGDINDIPAVIKDDKTLFDSDVVVFTASKSVPTVGANIADVRLHQLKGNAIILESYIEQAVACHYNGMFCIMSDPVDLLCKVALEKARALDSKLLTPVKIRGFGLGVMYARARYYAGDMQLSYFDSQAMVFGPHGTGLVVVDNYSDVNLAVSKVLAEKAVKANLEVRGHGQKPYIAPALSSGALSIIAMLEGRWQHSAVYFDRVFCGVKNRMTTRGIELKTMPYHQRVAQWLNSTLSQLEKQYETLHT